MPPLPQQPQAPPPVLGGPDAFNQSLQKHRQELEAPAPQAKAFDPRVGADPLRGILDPIQVDNAIKRQALDAYHRAQTPEEFRKYFDSAALPQETKRELWNLKCAAPIETAAEAPQATRAQAAQRVQ